jgi:archaeosortase A (PGF-CTERM-specific)
MGIGYYLSDRRRHKFRMEGLIYFGFFWILQTPFFLLIGDVFNAMICVLALPFYAYLGYNEYLSYVMGEENASLKWITGASFFGGGLYFLIDKIPILSGYLILIVAAQSVWLINLFGFNYGLGNLNYAGNELWYRTNYNEISIHIEGSTVALVQACTAIQSILIFVGAIYCVQAAANRKWKGFFATVPVIYVLNLVRNVGVIYMIEELGWSYEFSHHTVGKGASFLALIVLAFIAFKILPELLDNIWGLIELPDRFKKKEEEVEGEEEIIDGEIEEDEALDEEGVEGEDTDFDKDYKEEQEETEVEDEEYPKGEPKD